MQREHARLPNHQHRLVGPWKSAVLLWELDAHAPKGVSSGTARSEDLDE